jgi:hypothetical protein
MVPEPSYHYKRECDPDRWDSDKGRISGKTEEAKSFNAYLDAVQLKIYDIFQSFISTGIDFDGEKIKARYLGFDVEKPRMFLEVYEEHNKEFEQLVGKGLSYRTLQKYKTIKAYVAEFLKCQYALNDIELNQIDYQFIKNLEIYFKSVKHCCHNTAMVVERIRLMNKAASLMHLTKFNIGDRVSWDGSDGVVRTGVIIRLNNKTVLMERLR